MRGDGFIGFIEAGAPGEGKVVFVREDLQAVVCPPESGARWGLGATGRSVAWLERPEGARRDRIVTVREIDPELTACPTSVRQRILTGEVDRDIGVHLTNTHALWFERSPALYVNRVHRWAFADPRAESPEIYRPPQSVSGVAVDMVTAGDVVVFVRYRPQPAPRYSFEFVPSGLATYVEPLADVRRPSLSPHYFMWAENQRNPAWEVRYARLP